MESFIIWIVTNWVTALVYYILAGLVLTTITSFYLGLRGQGTPIPTLVVSVLLPPVWAAMILAAIIRIVLLWLIDKYRGPVRWERRF